MRTFARWAPALLIVTAILVFWEAFVRIGNIANWLLPAPSSIGYTLYDSASLLASHSLVTLGEILIGFVLALASGLVLASGITLSKTLEKAL